MLCDLSSGDVFLDSPKYVHGSQLHRHFGLQARLLPLLLLRFLLCLRGLVRFLFLLFQATSDG